MLVEFSVENFLSFETKQTLSFEAVDETNAFECGDYKLLKSAAIFGANASGKSNLIRAFLNFASKIAGENKKVLPFYLGDEVKNISKFSAKFIINANLYEYGFWLNRESVVEKEWLRKNVGTESEDVIFERNGLEFEFGKNLELYKNIQQKISESSLFVSFANALFDISDINLVTEFFAKFFVKKRDKAAELYEFCKNKNNKEKLLSFIKAVDVDIEDVLVEKDKTDDSLKIKTKHKSRGRKSWLFPLSLESTGTKNFLYMVSGIIDVLDRGGVMLVDELDRSFHPLMVRFVLDLFHSKKTNPKNAQLIFTTHDVSLLDRTILTPDQIWFCQKKNKATELYSLCEFKLYDDEVLFELPYLLGQFGGVANFKGV